MGTEWISVLYAERLMSSLTPKPLGSSEYLAPISSESQVSSASGTEIHSVPSDSNVAPSDSAVTITTEELSVSSSPTHDSHDSPSDSKPRWTRYLYPHHQHTTHMTA